jgi:hypothetical protein
MMMMMMMTDDDDDHIGNFCVGCFIASFLRTYFAGGYRWALHKGAGEMNGIYGILCFF